MDTFARALVMADKLLTSSPYPALRAERYASFASGEGADFAAGKLSLEDLATCGIELGEPATLSGKQECYEALLNQYI